MADAMVTARMSQSKKNAGGEVLERLGMSASQAINALYDSLIERQVWPIEQQHTSAIDAGKLAEAFAVVDSIAKVDSSDFEDMSMKDAKRRRLVAKGRAKESDFS